MNERVPISYLTPDGERHAVEAVAGDTVMSTALANHIPGILANCGGAEMCATCHVYVEQDFVNQLPEMDDEEDGLLGFTASERQPTSRLSCQLVVTHELAGLEVRIPEAQV